MFQTLFSGNYFDLIAITVLQFHEKNVKITEKNMIFIFKNCLKHFSSKQITQFHEISKISLIFCISFFSINH